MIGCDPCKAWGDAQPAGCDGRTYCSEDNGWSRGDLKEVFDDGYRRMLCPKCSCERAKAIDWESRGDYLYDRMKDEGY